VVLSGYRSGEGTTLANVLLPYFLI
jgi:hypothetical protein